MFPLPEPISALRLTDAEKHLENNSRLIHLGLQCISSSNTSLRKQHRDLLVILSSPTFPRRPLRHPRPHPLPHDLRKLGGFSPTPAAPTGGFPFLGKLRSLAFLHPTPPIARLPGAPASQWPSASPLYAPFSGRVSALVLRAIAHRPPLCPSVFSAFHVFFHYDMCKRLHLHTE